jgi:hypothetical protein
MSIGAKSEYNTQGNARDTDLKNIHMKLKMIYIGLMEPATFSADPLIKN